MNAAAASGPVVDGAFIPDYPDQMVRDGRFVKDVAILTGKLRAHPSKTWFDVDSVPSSLSLIPGNEDDEGALVSLLFGLPRS